MKKETKKSVRLVPHIRPVRYRLMIHPSQDHEHFKGEETIELTISKPTKIITLHAADLDIGAAVVLCKKQKQSAEISYNKTEETATFTVAKAISGKCELDLKFSGLITDKLAGFYRGHYEHEGGKKTIATTQFEPVDARRAFPCFDEPANKAIFDITIMVPKGQVAISNTYEIDEGEPDAEYRIVKFAPTPKMSTYLVAFIVGNFDYTEAKTKNGVRVRVFATPGKKKQTEYALEATVKILEYYTEYFGIKYPLPVLDLIAVPDFPVGAMENWGAITYRETALLIDQNNSSAAAKQRVTLVIAHELAHQWFGNLVTMEWWTQLWLNEGFASWIEYLAMDHLHPEWQIWEQFHTMDKAEALHLDALASTHPIEVTVGHPKEIGSIFDAVSYHKGASVINMLHAFLGAKTFQKGLQHYLKKHAYGNTVTEDLWRSLSAVSGINVQKIMNGWIKKPGYPVVRVNEKKGKLFLTQERFFSNPKSKTKNKESWEIPVTFKQAENWTLVNAGQAGFFRTLYEPKLLAELKEPISKKLLAPVDRLAILSDAFAGARANLASTRSVLEILSAYKGEDNYNVWVEIAGVLGAIDFALHGRPSQKEFRKFAIKLLEPIMKELNYVSHASDSHSTSLLRGMIMNQLGRYGYEETVSRARAGWNDMVNGIAEINPDLRAAVYNTVAHHGGQKEYEEMLALWHKAEMQEEKNRLAIALGLFHDPVLALRTLDFSISDAVRQQDTRIVQAGVTSNPHASGVTWQWTQKNWPLLYDRFAHTGSAFNHLVLGLFAHFQTEEQVREAKSCWKKNKDKQKGAERPFAQCMESVEGRLLWHKKAIPEIEKFLTHLK